MARVVIVGGGVSGLSAGIYAQMSGHSAVICERHGKAGGNLTGWQRGGYHIDNCIHWLTGTNPVTDTYRMWCDLGALGEGVEVYQGESLYTCSRGGMSVSLFRDLERTRRNMLEISPKDARETEDFIALVKVFEGIMGIASESHDKHIGAGGLVLSFPRLMKYYLLSTGELASRFEHPLLRDFIRGVMGDEFGAIALAMVFAIFCGENGGIPKGGSVGMADRMVSRFLSLGGQLLLKSEVLEIEREGRRAKKVRLSDGRELDSDYVILTSDPAVAFPRLLKADMPRALKKQYADRRMMRFSSVHCAFSCDSEELPFKADHIFEIPKREQRLLRSKYLVLREFSHEPSFAPSGKNIIQSLVFCGEREARKYIALSKSGHAYRAKKEELARVAMSLIEERFPSLCGRLECIDVWTPATYKRFTDCDMGSYMSFILPPRTLPRRIDCRISGLENVYLATQWQQSPGGLPTAAACGRGAVEAINKQERRYSQRFRETKAYAR